MTKMSHPTNSGQEPQTLSPALARERVAEALKNVIAMKDGSCLMAVSLFLQHCYFW